MLNRNWLFVITDSLNLANAPVTLRFSSEGYEDSLGNTYDTRMIQPASFSAGCFSGGIVPFVSGVSYGEVVLANADGALNYLVDYAVDSRVATVSYVSSTGAIVESIRASVESLVFEQDTVSVRLRNPFIEKLESIHPYRTYLGNNVLPDGLEGGTEIRGTQKPQVFGRVINAVPVLVNTSKLIYQISDYDFTLSPASKNPFALVEAVYDRGIPLTAGTEYSGDITAFLTDAVSPGTYSWYRPAYTPGTLGAIPVGGIGSPTTSTPGTIVTGSSPGTYFRLGASPTGTITFDARCKDVSNKILRLGEVYHQIMYQVRFVDNTNFVEADGDIMSVAVSKSTNSGFYYSEEMTTIDMLKMVADTASAFLYVDSNNRFRATRFGITSLAVQTPTVFLNDSNVLSISRDSTATGINNTPIYRVRARGERVQFVQDDLAAGVSDTFRNKVAQEFTEAIISLPAILTRYPSAGELVIETIINVYQEMLDTANYVINIVSQRRDSLTLELPLIEDFSTKSFLTIGRIMNVATSKLGYSVTPRNLILVGYEIDALNNKVIIKLFG